MSHAFATQSSYAHHAATHSLPIGRVISGMETLDSLYGRYGDIPASPAPLGNPRRLYGESNKYLDAEFPKLDKLIRIVIR